MSDDRNSAGKYTIRVMRREDIPQVVSIEKRIFSAPWSEKSFTDAFSSDDNIYLVAVSEGKVVGYCGMWVSCETADLCNMAVVPGQRRRGIGEALLRKGAECVRERCVEKIFLEVRVGNESAVSLYRKNGFEQVGIRKGYYSLPKEDALVLQLQLPACISCGQ